MSKATRLTIPDTGNLEFPADLLQMAGLEAGDELVVIPTEDGFFVGSREKVMEHLLKAFDEKWQDDDLTMETFLARRSNIADALLQKHYGLVSSDLDE
ncbi:MAG: AbrB/MazE/SpoVT family DNA-binding domain-containing protein [Chloroflexi bacterium]|nr:MAG: hypothetical protein CUN54_07130 [Phototrophicales bacterium]RMF82590.1 MAG: AbrB/MazE/SpoVT family DNA-binding domain-containing protein [Chloroflexota bacterium]